MPTGNARQRDSAGRFVKSDAAPDPRADPDAELAAQVYADQVGPDVMGVVKTLTGERYAVEPARASEREPMEKWAGQPQSGGMGGSLNPTEEQEYDPSKKPGMFTEVGASGLAQYGGFVRDEFLLQLQGNNARKVFREMWDNDPIIGALVFAIQMLVRKTEWRVEPPEAGTVEEIVQERYLERQQAAQEAAQAQQQALMEAQAGLAGNSSSATRAGPDGKPTGPGGPPRGPTPSHAQGVLSQTGPIHAPLDSPGTNAPATGDGPGTNPGGGPAQDAALNLDGGLPGNGQKPTRKSIFEKARQMFKAAPTALDDAPAPPTDAPPTDALNPLDPGSAGSTPTTPAIGSRQARLEDPNDPTSAMNAPAGPPRDVHAEEVAVFVETCFHDMADGWSDVLAQIITMIVFGFSYHELVYKKRNGPNPDFPDQGSRFSDGKLGWAKIAGRAQETLHRWEFDENGNILGFWQLAPPKYRLKYVPLSKALLFRTTAYKNNPEGRSVLRSAYRPWYFKKRIEEYEAIGVERDLAGLPVAFVPYQYMTSSATPEEIAALAEIKKIVRNLRRNEQEGVVFPNLIDPDSHEKLFTLELLASPSRRQFDTNEIITRYEQRIAMNALADFILLGHDSVGARSLGETKVDLFSSAMEAWLSSIADVFNTYAIPRLMQINGEDPAESPKLTFGKIGEIPVDEVAKVITALAGAGADLFPDTQLEDFFREKFGWPPKAASDDL